MFGVFKKKEKLPLTVSGEYNGSYSPVAQKVLSAELSFAKDGVDFIFDKGIKKEKVKTFAWEEIEGFDYKYRMNDKDIIFDIVLYLLDGEYILIKETIPKNSVQMANKYGCEAYYKKTKQYILDKKLAAKNNTLSVQ